MGAVRKEVSLTLNPPPLSRKGCVANGQTNHYKATNKYESPPPNPLRHASILSTRPCIVEVVDFDRRSLVTTVDIIIREGKNRQIRRMFEGIGHDVRSITRISHGPIRLKDLRPGEWRSLEQVTRAPRGFRFCCYILS